MKEYYNPNTEFINSYGQDTSENEALVPEFENQEEMVEESYNPIFSAEEYLKQYSDEERIEMDSVAKEQGAISEYLISGNPIERENASYAVLGSVFASAPSSEEERDNLPAWKLVLGGAARGAKVATLAVSMMLPLLAQSKNKKSEKIKDKGEVVAPVMTPEDMAIQKIGDNLFGKDFLGIKQDRKEWYMEMEREKRNLIRHLEDESEMAPRSEEERTMFRSIESKRDRMLAEIKIQEVKLLKESMQVDLNDPEVVAVIDAKKLKLEEEKAKVIHNFESEIKRAYNSRGRSEKTKMIRSRIDEIERDQKRLVNHEIRRSNSYYHSGWSY